MTTVLTQVIARLLLLPTLVLALAVLVKGYADTGDGFSAAVIAATGVALQYIAFGYREAERALPAHWAPAAAGGGLLLVLLVVFGPVLRGEPLLAHWPAPTAAVPHFGTLEVTTAVLFDVGVFLLVLGFTVSTVSAIAHAVERRSS